MPEVSNELKFIRAVYGECPDCGVNQHVHGEKCAGEHQVWCGDPAYGRPVDHCTCHITPEQQAKENKRREDRRERFMMHPEDITWEN